MIDCNFDLNDDGLWQCQTCGWIYKRRSDKPPRRNCRPLGTEEKAEQARQLQCDLAEGEKLGWTLEDAKNWRLALRRWRQAGKPRRTDAEVIAILEICETCDEYHTNEQRCGKCRCCVSRRGMAVFNKARLGTENCPLDKW